MEIDENTRHHIDSKIDDLATELGERIPRPRIEAVVEETLDELQGARFPDFLPILTYRFARERLTTRS